MWNLWRTEQSNRQAAVVLSWVEGAMVIENRGPASARNVRLVVEEGDAARESEEVPLLPAGFVHRVPYERGLYQTPQCDLSWHDGGRRRRSLVLSPSEQTPNRRVEKPPLSDRQVRDLADGLAAGIAKGFKEYMTDVARRGGR